MGPAILKMDRYVCKAKQRIFLSNSSKLESTAIIANCAGCKVTLNGKALLRAHDLQHILSPTSAGCSKTQNTNTNTNTNTKVQSCKSANCYGRYELLKAITIVDWKINSCYKATNPFQRDFFKDHGWIWLSSSVATFVFATRQINICQRQT